jgi:PQQ-like domain
MIDPSLEQRKMGVRFALAVCAAVCGAGLAPASAQINVTTYHYDNLRTGWNPNETVLTTSNVNSSSFGVVAQTPLDAQVDAQPLVVDGVAYVVTENNTVYAIDAVAGTILSSVNLGTPVFFSKGGCGNANTSIGIKSTPVIDAQAGVMYVTTYTSENGAPTWRIHQLTIPDLSEITNTVASETQLLDDQTTTFTFNATYQIQRAGLLEANGNVYAAFQAICDGHGNVSRGMVLGWNAATLAPLPANLQPPNPSNELMNTQVSSDTPPCTSTCPKFHNYYLSSIWMSGFGIASDASGDLFFSTGNSNGVVAHNFQNSAVRLSPDLTTIKDYFTPSSVMTLDSSDADLSGGGVMVVPDQPGIQPRVVAAGKAGTLYVMNRTLGRMGGYVPGGPDKPLEITIGQCHCGPSYFVGSDGVGRIVTSGGPKGTASFLRTYKNTAVFPTTYEAQYTLLPTSVQDNSFFTSVSSNGTQVGSAIIWAVGRPTSATSESAMLKGGAAIDAPDFSLTGAGTRLVLSENLAYSGALTIGAGANVSVVSGDALTLTGTDTLSGSATGLGTVAIAGGTTTVNRGATLTVSNWSVSGAGTNLVVDETLTYRGGFSAGSGATLTLSGGNLTLTGANTFAGATTGGAGTLTDSAAAVSGLTIGGTTTFDNTKTLTESGGAVTVGDASGNAATLINAATGIYDITDDSGIGFAPRSCHRSRTRARSRRPAAWGRA